MECRKTYDFYLNLSNIYTKWRFLHYVCWTYKNQKTLLESNNRIKLCYHNGMSESEFCTSLVNAYVILTSTVTGLVRWTLVPFISIHEMCLNDCSSSEFLWACGSLLCVHYWLLNNNYDELVTIVWWMYCIRIIIDLSNGRKVMIRHTLSQNIAIDVTTFIRVVNNV